MPLLDKAEGEAGESGAATDEAAVIEAVKGALGERVSEARASQRLTDRAADVVVLIDTYRQPAGPATEATERVVRGAAQVVQTALRHGDRAGIVALGGNRPRWLGADIGQRQFYRVLDTVLGAGDRRMPVSSDRVGHRRVRSATGAGARGAAALRDPPLEALDAPAGVDQLLTAGVERVAGGADLDVDLRLG